MVTLRGQISIPDGLNESDVFADLNTLAATIPGLIDLAWQTEQNFRGRMKMKLPVGIVSSRITGEVQHRGPQIAIRIKGTVANVAGGFDAKVTLAGGSGGFVYELTVQFSGWLASLGEGLLTPIMAAQARQFEKNFSEFLTAMHDEKRMNS